MSESPGTTYDSSRFRRSCVGTRTTPGELEDRRKVRSLVLGQAHTSPPPTIGAWQAAGVDGSGHRGTMNGFSRPDRR